MKCYFSNLGIICITLILAILGCVVWGLIEWLK